MTFITTLSRKNLMLKYCLLIQTIFMKNYLNINTCLTLVNIYQTFLIQQTKKVIGEMKDEFKGIPINKFIGLK